LRSDPAGEPIGEVAATDPGESGGATMTYTSPGVFTYHASSSTPQPESPTPNSA